MMEEDQDLAELVRNFSAMSSLDRAYVLEQLSADETRCLESYLTSFEARSMSQALNTLVSDCADGQIPKTVTPRAASAIRRTAQTELALPHVRVSSRQRDEGSFVKRIGAWISAR